MVLCASVPHPLPCRDHVNPFLCVREIFSQDQEKAEAVVHIQRIGRGREARRRVAAIKQSRETLDIGVTVEPSASIDTAVEGSAHKVTSGGIEDVQESEESQDVQDTDGRHSPQSSKVEEGTTVEGADEHGPAGRGGCYGRDETEATVAKVTVARSSKRLADDLPERELANETEAAARIQVRGSAYLRVWRREPRQLLVREVGDL